MLRNRLGVSFSHPTLRRIEAASGGNPFLALEIGRAFGRRSLMAPGASPLPVPDTVAELVQERLAQLDDDALGSMRILALMPEPTLDRALAAGADEAALHAAGAAGFLDTSGRVLRFSHPLLSSVVAESTPPADRRALHARLAETATESQERVRHLALAAPGPSAETAGEVEAAAREAISRGAPATAAELFALAASLTPDELAPLRRTRELEAVDYLAIAGDTRAARALLERLVRETSPGPDRGEALLRLARIREDDFDAAEELAHEALEQARDDARLRADLHLVVSDIATARGDGPRSREHARLALEQAERAGDPALIASTLTQVVWLDWGAGHPLDRDRLDRALALEGTVDPLLLRASPSQVAGHALLAAGRLDEARTAFEAALAQAESAGVQYWWTDVTYRLCLLEGRAGNLARADELADAGLDAAEQLGLEQLVSAVLYGRGLTHLLLGRVNDARAAAERGLAASREVGERRYAVRNAWLLGYIDLASGRTAEAASQLMALVEPIRALGDPAFSRSMLPAIVEAQLAVGAVDGARDTQAMLEHGVSDPPSAAQARRGRGAIAAAEGKLDSALALLEEAVRLHDEAPLPLERAETLMVLGAVQRRLKQRGAARQTLGEALAVAERIGAPLWVARARAELGRVSGRAPGSDGLTESERRVAELVAQGLTNKEVASSLFVSVRAVESNLSKVYAKLGVRSRTELAGRLGKLV
jgi:DNA-binding CsgD family transcriptional regulator